MTLLFVILIIIFAFGLGLVVLIQNPKGGGLAGSFSGISTQFMGVKQTTDFLEKGTWIFAGLIGLLCLFSSFFISKGASTEGTNVESKASGAPLSAPAPTPQQKSAVPLAPGTSIPVTPPAAKSDSPK
jgi:preprotein translocase subunit SecG